MKSLTKPMFVLLFLMAGSLAIMGQNTLLVNSFQTLLAYSADIQTEIELSAEYTASSYRFYMEEKMQLEDWMIEESTWRDESFHAITSYVRLEQEPEIEMEPWMIQPFSASSQEIWDFLVEIEEEPLEVHKWMICCADWNLKANHDSWMKSPVKPLE